MSKFQELKKIIKENSNKHIMLIIRNNVNPNLL